MVERTSLRRREIGYVVVLCCMLFASCSGAFFDAPCVVAHGEGGLYTFVFRLNQFESVQVDIIAPSRDFQFVLSKSTSNPFPLANSPKSVDVLFLNFKIQNEANLANLSFRGSIKYVFAGIPVPPETLSFLIHDNSGWKFMSQPSVLTVETRSISQAFLRTELKPDKTYFAVMGSYPQPAAEETPVPNPSPSPAPLPEPTLTPEPVPSPSPVQEPSPFPTPEPIPSPSIYLPSPKPQESEPRPEKSLPSAPSKPDSSSGGANDVTDSPIQYFSQPIHNEEDSSFSVTSSIANSFHFKFGGDAMDLKIQNSQTGFEFTLTKWNANPYAGCPLPNGTLPIAFIEMNIDTTNNPKADLQIRYQLPQSVSYVDKLDMVYLSGGRWMNFNVQVVRNITENSITQLTTKGAELNSTSWRVALVEVLKNQGQQSIEEREESSLATSKNILGTVFVIIAGFILSLYLL